MSSRTVHFLPTLTTENCDNRAHHFNKIGHHHWQQEVCNHGTKLDLTIFKSIALFSSAWHVCTVANIWCACMDTASKFQGSSKVWLCRVISRCRVLFNKCASTTPVLYQQGHGDQPEIVRVPLIIGFDTGW